MVKPTFAKIVLKNYFKDVKLLKDNIDVVFIGDSLTFGYGVSKDNSWVSKITNYYNFTALNRGINGDTTASMLSRFDNDALKYNPKLIFLMGGSNDLLLRRSLDYITENIELMIKDALSKNINIIIGIPPFIHGSMAYNLFSTFSDYDLVEKDLIKLRIYLIKICLKYNINYVDFYSLTVNKKELYLDGIHLNSEGNNILFNAALKAFRK